MNIRSALVALLMSLHTLGFANDGFMANTGGALNYSNSKDIRLVSEDLRVTLAANGAKIRVEFLFKNEGKAQTAIMGFPENWSEESSEGALAHFRTTVDGKPVQATRKVIRREEDDYGAVWTKSVTFAAGQSRRVRVEYEPNYSGTAYGFTSLDYIFTTGATWKGKIGQMQITVDETHANPKEEVHLNLVDAKWNERPAAWKTSSSKIHTLTLRDVEPDFNLSVHLLPWFWRFTVNGKEVPSGAATRVTFPVPRMQGSELIASPYAIGAILGGPTPDDSWDLFGAISPKGGFLPSIVDNHTIQIGDRRITLKRGLVRLSGAGGEPPEAAYLSDFVQALGGSYRFDPKSRRVFITVPKS